MKRTEPHLSASSCGDNDMLRCLVEWLFGKEVSVQIDPLNAFASILVAAAGGWIAWRLGRHEKIQGELDALSMFREQVVGFAKDVVTLMAEGIELARIDPTKCPTYCVDRLRLEIKLSAAIDLGRLFFPNEDKSSNKAGLRPAILNRIMAAHEAVSALNYKTIGHNHIHLPIGELLEWRNSHPDSALQSVDDRLRRRLLRAFDHLSDHAQEQLRQPGINGATSGWSCERALIHAKRGFIEEIGHLAAPEKWLGLVARTIPLEYVRRNERPG